MNLDRFIREIGESLEFVNKNKQIKFINYWIKTLDDAESRDLAESRLLSYIQTGDKSAIVRPRTICFTLHGIRTDGTWQADLKRLLERNYENIETVPLKFGFWNAISFLIPWKIDRPIIHIESELKSAFNSDAISETTKVLVAHSYGTYVMHSVLNLYSGYKFDRILFCGSVLKADSDIEKLSESIIVNDCGTKDVYPSIAGAFSFRYGTAGLTGLTRLKVNNRYHIIGHSGFFTEEFMRKHWLRFIADGRIEDSGINARTPYALQLIGIIPGIGIYMILALIVISTYLAFI